MAAYQFKRSRSSNYQSATLRTSRLQVRVLPDAPIHAALAQLQEALRSDRRGCGWKSLTRHQFAHVAQSRGSALKTRPVSVPLRPWAPAARVAQRRGTKLKPSRVQVQVPPRAPAFALSSFGSAGHFGMSTGQARRASVLTSACLRASGASPRHSANFADGHRPACSSKRTVRLINGIALDECRVGERYPARRPAFTCRVTARQAISHLRARSSSSGLIRGVLVGERDQPEVCFI